MASSKLPENKAKALEDYLPQCSRIADALKEAGIHMVTLVRAEWQVLTVSNLDNSLPDSLFDSFGAVCDETCSTLERSTSEDHVAPDSVNDVEVDPATLIKNESPAQGPAPHEAIGDVAVHSIVIVPEALNEHDYCTSASPTNPPIKDELSDMEAEEDVPDGAEVHVVKLGASDLWTISENSSNDNLVVHGLNSPKSPGNGNNTKTRLKSGGKKGTKVAESIKSTRFKLEIKTKLKNKNNSTPPMDKELPEKNSEGKYPCSFCTRSFIQGHNWKMHKRTHTGEKLSVCRVCQEKFMTVRQLQLHMETHPGKRKYLCAKCPETFMFPIGLKVHERANHSSLPCPKCGRICKDAMHLRGHIQVHSTDQIPCPTCGKLFRTNRYLTLHMRIHRKEPFKCSTCMKEYFMERGALQCEKRHLGQYDYVCECGKKYVDIPNFSRHKLLCQYAQQSSEGSDKYQCSMCNKLYNRQIAAENCIKKHCGQYDYPCTCGKKFVNITHYKKHHKKCKSNPLRVVGQFKCNLCENTFETQNTANICEKKHLNQYDFVCVCGKKFLESSQYKRHQKRCKYD